MLLIKAKNKTLAKNINNYYVTNIIYTHITAI